jgi:hypothetical protein
MAEDGGYKENLTDRRANYLSAAFATKENMPTVRYLPIFPSHPN